MSTFLFKLRAWIRRLVEAFKAEARESRGGGGAAKPRRPQPRCASCYQIGADLAACGRCGDCCEGCGTCQPNDDDTQEAK